MGVFLFLFLIDLHLNKSFKLCWVCLKWPKYCSYDVGLLSGIILVGLRGGGVNQYRTIYTLFKLCNNNNCA